MVTPPRPTPKAQSLGAALASHDTLAGLMQRLRDSRSRLATVQAVLPPGLQGAVTAGPLDDTQWILLAKHAAAAAKLRQCVPQIEQTLAAAGFEFRVVRVKLSQPG